MGLWADVKYRYSVGSLLTRLIYINVGVFVLLRLLAFLGLIFGFDTAILLRWTEFPSHFDALLYRPWTLITYMFSHYAFLHILFNMLWLYWLGRIFLEYFTPKQLGALYVLGGLGGALIFMLAYQFLPVFQGSHGLLIGASASVLAIVVAIAVYAPNYPIGLLFFGQVSLKWFAIISVAIIILGEDGNNLGGQMAHLGGGLVGLLYGLQMRQGHDITAGVNRAIDLLVTWWWNVKSTLQNAKYKKSKPISKKYNEPTEAEIDNILDKLKRSGYGALTNEERATLFRASKK